MSFFFLELFFKEKPIKSNRIMPHLKPLKKILLVQFFLKNKQKLQLIWTYENMVKF
jgi:hypothetical protein